MNMARISSNLVNVLLMLMAIIIVLPFVYTLLVLGSYFNDAAPRENKDIFLQHPYLTATIRPNIDINNHNYPILLSDGRLSRTGSHHLKTNSLGFRDREFNIQKSKDYRVCVLGGSVLLGGSDESTTITAILEKMLNKHLSVEVYNFGSAGWWSRQELFIYETIVTKYKCDVVWVHDGRNDAITGVVPVYAKNWDSWDSYRMDILSKSGNLDRAEKYFYPLIKIRNSLFPLSSEHKIDCVANYQNSANNGCAGAYKYRPEQLDVYFTNLRALAALVKNDGAKLIISTQPTLLWGKNKMHEVESEVVSTLSSDYIASMNQYRKEIINTARKVSAAYGSCYVDLTKQFYDDDRFLYYDDVHHNELGNEAIAREISPKISRLIFNNSCEDVKQLKR